MDAQELPSDVRRLIADAKRAAEASRRSRLRMVPVEREFDAADFVSMADVVDAIRDLKGPPGTKSEEPRVAVWLGEGRVRVGDEPPFMVEPQFADVLEALVELGAATKPQLQKTSGRDDADRLLRKLVRRFTSLQPYISFPGRRGKGGYSTTIKAER